MDEKLSKKFFFGVYVGYFGVSDWNKLRSCCNHSIAKSVVSNIR